MNTMVASPLTQSRLCATKQCRGDRPELWYVVTGVPMRETVAHAQVPSGRAISDMKPDAERANNNRWQQ